MFPHKLQCSQCEHSWSAGRSVHYETEVLVGGVFLGVYDPLGLWAWRDGEHYCSPCSERIFPQITDENVVLKQTACCMF